MPIFNAISRLMRLSGFKFQSPQITLAAIVAINVLTTANLVAELTIDLKPPPPM